jgi:hypothetical protein
MSESQQRFSSEGAGPSHSPPPPPFQRHAPPYGGPRRPPQRLLGKRKTNRGNCGQPGLMHGMAEPGVPGERNN